MAVREPPPLPAPSGPLSPPVLRRMAGIQEVGLLVVIVAVFVVVAVLSRGQLLNADILLNYAKDTSFVAIMAIGVMTVIVTGGIDLSIASIYALAGVLGALVLWQFGPVGPLAGNPWLGTLLGIAIALAAGALAGLINGVAVVGLRVHPFIITLGTMQIFRGIAFLASRAQSIGNFPGTYTDGLVRHDLWLGGGLLPVPLLAMVFMAVLGTVYMGHTVAGRHVYAVGGNLEAARFSGLKTGRILISVYVIAGLCAGVAAVLANGVYGSATSNRGMSYELRAIAAAVVGGASLSGGRGTALGAVLGALLIQLIEQSMVTLAIDQNYYYPVIGTAVIAAVVLDRLSTRTTARRTAARERTDAGSKPGTPDSEKGESP